MKCPFCGYDETKVLDSRPASNGTSIRRRRECLQCQARFTTYERYEQTRLRIIKKDGRRELYDRKKLMNGILKACEKRPVSTDQIEEMVDNIEEQLRRSGYSEIYSSEIGDKVMDQLKSIDQVAYVRFASVYKEFRDLDSFLQAIRELKNS
ncbi:transcriptional regulator NrdR [Petrotoga olearia]|uniref:Transcriptional repressor NrdR n=2 Tax=Petrotoga olearia TaxID=156203 RepID=A0A2K1NWW8_9BACT|nr:transcriptional regulator NrdR [Petrotoga olearia]PNR95032.1 NrdR family transcriptional regulator [Petrotoga olearia DSM 13574]RMA72939.1 transcriptional repressor NrdR [Petrotoga olearia]